ncbi:MAG TPA: hypothetical protein EYP10_08000 [Armatimonadetes bacterium]|nr:hypothetical protein [Armatimonadota bacterium]
MAGQTPVITAMAQSVSRLESETWPAAKRIYRFIYNKRFDHQLLFAGVYRIARCTVERERPERLVVAIDPVNFEKPYARALEGISTVHKSTPPDHLGRPRLARGYPAITATVVNTQVPAISYANWFSYKAADFISENWEIYRAMRTTREVFAQHRLRFVADAGLDDQKIFAWMDQLDADFVIRASHLERRIEVYNPRLDRWESEILQDLVDTVPFEVTFQVAFTHAGRTRLAKVRLGWFLIRLPETQQQLWVLVAEDITEQRTLVLLTNVPLIDLQQVKAVYGDWRLRGHIEHGYRFDQEQGLDVEDLRVRTLERMRRLFALVLLAAMFVFYLMKTWPSKAVYWLRMLGGKLALSTDRDGPYILLRGISAVLQTVTTVTFLARHPFPHDAFP